MAEKNFRKKLYPDYKKKKPKKPKIHPNDIAPEVGHQQAVDQKQAVQDADMKEEKYLKDPETEVDTSKPLQIKKGTVDYSKTNQEKEFDDAVDSLSHEGKYQRPPLKNLRRGVEIKNRTQLAIQAASSAVAAGSIKLLRELLINNPLRGAM
jgi:hypothetical protein